MKRLILSLTLLSLIPATAFSQRSRDYGTNVLAEYYFGLLPSARAMAMGNADVSVGGAVGSIFYNPAAIGSLQGLHTEFSEATPFYALSNCRYHYLGGSYRLNEYLNAAVTFRQEAVGETTFDINVNGNYYPLDKPRDTDFGLTLAATPVKNLHIGAGVHQLRRRDRADLKGNVMNFDVGLLYALELPSNEKMEQKLQFGASVTNFTRGIMDFSIAGDTAYSPTPSFFRAGISYHADFKNTGWSFLTQAEYQNVFTYEYATAYRWGAEVGWKNLIFGRVGAFTLSQDALGLPEINRSRETDFTYGFGTRIPLHDLSKGKIPFDLNADLTVLELQGGSFSTPRLDNFSNFAFRMTWFLEE